MAETVIVLKIHKIADHLEGMFIATRGLHMLLPVSVCSYEKEQIKEMLKCVLQSMIRVPIS